MAHFYGTVQGERGEGTRIGHRGMTTRAASWKGAIKVELSIKDDVDWALVTMVPWRNKGEFRVLYEGPVGEYKPCP